MNRKLIDKRHRASESGFTLAEIIIVFAIIGLLSTYMMGSSFLNARRRARDSQRRAQVKEIAVALEQYYNDYDRYPESNVDGEIVACGAGGNSVCEWGEQFADANDTIYMGKLPEDTATSNTFYYRTGPAGLAWQMYTVLEQEDYSDLDRDDNGTYEPANDGYNFIDCGPGYCNYGVSSGNITPDMQDLSGF